MPKGVVRVATILQEALVSDVMSLMFEAPVPDNCALPPGIRWHKGSCQQLQTVPGTAEMLGHLNSGADFTEVTISI